MTKALAFNGGLDSVYKNKKEEYHLRIHLLIYFRKKSEIVQAKSIVKVCSKNGKVFLIDAEKKFLEKKVLFKGKKHRLIDLKEKAHYVNFIVYKK